MESKFSSEEVEYLYNLVIKFNQSIMEDLTQESIHKFKIIRDLQ